MSNAKVNTKEKFSDRLKRWRARYGLSQARAAAELKISRSYYSQVENGREPGGLLEQKLDLVENAPVNTVNNGAYPGNAEIVSVRGVPLVSWAQAGEAVDYEELPRDWQRAVPTDLSDPKAFALTITGDSMEPKFQEGDVAILNPSSPLRQNDAVIARIADQGVVFKLYSREGNTIRFASYNPAYAPFHVPASKVLWAYPVHSVWKRLMK